MARASWNPQFAAERWQFIPAGIFALRDPSAAGGDPKIADYRDLGSSPGAIGTSKNRFFGTTAGGDADSPFVAAREEREYTKWFSDRL